MCYKKLSWVYQEILVFNYFKNSIKRCLKCRECIFSNKKSKSFQGPKVGPGPQPIKAHFICMTSLHKVGKKVQNFWFGPPLYKKLAAALSQLTSINCIRCLVSQFCVGQLLVFNCGDFGFHMCHLNTCSLTAIANCNQWGNIVTAHIFGQGNVFIMHVSLSVQAVTFECLDPEI